MTENPFEDRVEIHFVENRIITIRRHAKFFMQNIRNARFDGPSKVVRKLKQLLLPRCKNLSCKFDAYQVIFDTFFLFRFALELHALLSIRLWEIHI